MKLQKILLTLAVLCAASVFAETPSFKVAKPVWAEGREKEMNVNLSFFGRFEIGDVSATNVLRITGCSAYRIYVNGKFAGYGPARGPKGYDRLDEWNLAPYLSRGTNCISIDVAGYNCPSYYLVNQPSYLQAEVETNGRIVLATSADSGFVVSVAPREQKVPRFSFQRTFTEVWHGPSNHLPPAVKLAEQPQKPLLPRIADYPTFTVNDKVVKMSEGRARYDASVPLRTYWTLLEAGTGNPVYPGFATNECTVLPSVEADRYVDDPNGKVRTHLYDFGHLDTGFIGFKIKKSDPKDRIIVVFDEILTDGKLDFLRSITCNAVVYNCGLNDKAFETFEPYAFRYVKVILDGDIEIETPYLRTYKSPSADGRKCPTSDPVLAKIFEAGRETFKQNAVDVFTDCPGRERAGWLCDSYFTAQSSLYFTGSLKLEELFLQNYLLCECPEMPKGMFPMCYPADHLNKNFIPNWAMWLVLELHDYAARGGDPKLVEAYRVKVLELVDYLLKFENSDGLLERLPSWVFVEWSAANSFTQDVNYPSNMTWARVLEVVSEMYQRPDLAVRAKKVREEVRKQSFDGTWFRDNAVRGKDGTLSVTTNHTETCQYYAFYFNTATPETYPALWKTLTTEFGPSRKVNNLHPDVPFSNAFIGNYLRLDLLAREGRLDLVEKEIAGYFAGMADRTGTLWEHDDTTASCCHGFASYVSVLIDRVAKSGREDRSAILP